MLVDASSREKREEMLRRQGLQVSACPDCGEVATVEECRVERPGQPARVQRVRRCHSPRRRCAPKVLEEAPLALEEGRNCAVCRAPFTPKVANQKVCEERDCRREWKRLYMRGFWERQRQDLAEARRRDGEPLPLPRLAQELAALGPEDFEAVILLARAERRRRDPAAAAS